jgi:hypothetical protein
MTPEPRRIMKRTIPFDEWHGKQEWIETCPRYGDGQMVWIKEMPRSEWGDGLGAHDTIRTIIVLLGSCHHLWHALVGEDERREVFYFV